MLVGHSFANFLVLDRYGRGIDVVCAGGDPRIEVAPCSYFNNSFDADRPNARMSQTWCAPAEARVR